MALAVSPAIAGSVKLEGKGRLIANGHGTAVLGGTGKMLVEGNGFLLVKKISDDVVIRVRGEHGRKIEINDNTVLFVGFHGRAAVRGSRVKVVIAGSNIHLKAIGKGKAFLQGCGDYKVGGIEGHWDEAGVDLTYGELDYYEDEEFEQLVLEPEIDDSY
jgi:hypothetical protein